MFIIMLLNLQDYSQQPPAQELVARDLHDQEWHFRHIYRGISNIWSFFPPPASGSLLEISLGTV
jgi:hypothetical protein